MPAHPDVATVTSLCRGVPSQVARSRAEERGLRFSSALPQRTRDSTIRQCKRGGANLRTTSDDFWQNALDRCGFPRRSDGRE